MKLSKEIHLIVVTFRKEKEMLQAKMNESIMNKYVNKHVNNTNKQKNRNKDEKMGIFDQTVYTLVVAEPCG